MNRRRVPSFVSMAAAFLAAHLCQAAPARAEDGAALLKQAGVPGGLVVHLGCGQGALTEQLRAGPQFLVHGLDTDAGRVAAARAALRARGIYGPVSVDRYDGRRLPYADNLVNLVVVEDPAGVPEAELLRVLAPRGVALTRQGGAWRRVEKPWPEAMDEWTHYLHGADGNPVADDALVGPPKRLRWVGSPAWARHHDHMASMTSLVSAGGRLFYIFDEGSTASIQLPSRWRLVARDAFNGTILWKRDLDAWNTRHYPLKSGPAHLLRRLVAVGDRVYVTLGIDAPVSALDAATGETVRTYEGTERTREIVVSDGTVFLVADSAPSRLPAWRRVSTYVWENTRTANPGWGWKGGARKILACEAGSGRRLWQADAPVAPCSLAADAARVVFQDGEKLVCLDRASGKVAWKSGPAPTKLPVQTNTGPRVLLYGDIVLYAGNDGKMSGWSAKDGKKLWEQRHRPSGHMSLKDLFVVQGLVWTGAIANNADDGTFVGYDPRTGEKKKEIPADVKVHWFHHRCYPSKAAGKYLLTARNGTEYVDLERRTWTPNHWVRGGCIYGVMPCNGLTYASMDACGCQLEAKLAGFNALAAGPLPKPSPEDLSPATRLEKGPAYGQAAGPDAGPADWPTYRHDPGRSGTTTVDVPPAVKLGWQAEVGGRLSPPVAAAGMLFVSSIDTHTLHALDAGSGKALWAFTSGGRIDSPPTYFKGLVLFGSTDGHVYALRAKDGALAWRFRGAPIDRRVTAWEQLESAWPVHGSVLVHDGVLYCTAGRNMFLDGGIRFLKLDPSTGRLLGEVVMDDRDPESGEEMHLAYLKKTPGNTMPVALSDILSCDGRQLWMRSQKIGFDGRRREIGLLPADAQTPEDFHLFCQIGFLDDSWFFRSYWTYGRRMTGGYGGWYQAGRLVPAGRILCVDDRRVYGYGRKPQYMVNASVLEYQLFAADKAVTAEAIRHVRQAERAMNQRLLQKNASSSDWLLRHFYPPKDLTAAQFAWTLDQPAVVARAMAVAGGTVFLAGPPDLVDERRAYRLPDDPDVKAALERQAEALEGRHGGQLWALTKADGKPAARFALDTIPVFDGMAVADGRLFMATVDGRVLCLAADGTGALKPLDDQPHQVIWEKKEDPGYLLPPPVPKEGDFAKVLRCSVIASDLGYRLRAAGKKMAGLALKQLEKPVTGKVTFATRIAAPTGHGLQRNGYLAFGTGVKDADLVKCGLRFQNRRAVIIQGPVKGGTSKGAAVKAKGDKPVDVTVTVDLGAGTVRMTAGGVTVEAKLKKPMKSITHVGYAADYSLVDFAPVEIRP
jgi:outer membrane protein assembly factor BamB